MCTRSLLWSRHCRRNLALTDRVHSNWLNSLGLHFISVFLCVNMRKDDCISDDAWASLITEELGMCPDNHRKAPSTKSLTMMLLWDNRQELLWDQKIWLILGFWATRCCQRLQKRAYSAVWSTWYYHGKRFIILELAFTTELPALEAIVRPKSEGLRCIGEVVTVKQLSPSIE